MRSTTDAINSYITDMLALEEHIDKAVTGQIQALGDHSAGRGGSADSTTLGPTSISRT